MWPPVLDDVRHDAGLLGCARPGEGRSTLRKPGRPRGAAGPAFGYQPAFTPL